MSHLTKTTQKSLFETTVASRPRASVEPEPYFGPVQETRNTRVAVGVDMVPDEARQTRMANYPRYDWPSVENLKPRHRGHHY